jgi:P27 family predicted phage terminase small subunit
MREALRFMMDRDPECPDWLDDAAHREWHRLDHAGLTHRHDQDTVAAYCWVSSQWTAVRRIVDRLEEEGSTSWFDHEGQERPHPALAVEARLAADLLKLSEALGVERRGREADTPTRVLFLDEGD